MQNFLLVLGCLFFIVSLVGWVFALIAAFADEAWKGVVGLLCGWYLLYYAAFEYNGENQMMVVGLYVGGNIGSWVCFYLMKHVGS